MGCADWAGVSASGVLGPPVCKRAAHFGCPEGTGGAMVAPADGALAWAPEVDWPALDWLGTEALEVLSWSCPD